MINFFDTLYSKIKDNNKYAKKIRLYSVARLSVRIIANAIIPLYFKLTSKNSNYQINIDFKNNDEGLIVSLTSFPARINNTWLTIESILRQTKKPDCIILWLSKKQFPKLSDIPNSILKLQKRGLKIEIRDGDIKSHKKFYYVKKEYPKHAIILIDDDIIYPNYTISQLYNYSSIFPGKVICRYAKKISRSSSGELLPYREWVFINNGKISSDIFFGSGGGTLIPPDSINSHVLDINGFLSCCPTADDVWLNAMCRLNSIEFVSIEKPFSMLPVINLKNKTLSSINNTNDRNDQQIASTREYCIKIYGIDPFHIKPIQN